MRYNSKSILTDLVCAQNVNANIQSQQIEADDWKPLSAQGAPLEWQQERERASFANCCECPWYANPPSVAELGESVDAHLLRHKSLIWIFHDWRKGACRQAQLIVEMALSRMRCLLCSIISLKEAACALAPAAGASCNMAAVCVTDCSPVMFCVYACKCFADGLCIPAALSYTA